MPFLGPLLHFGISFYEFHKTCKECPQKDLCNQEYEDSTKVENYVLAAITQIIQLLIEWIVLEPKYLFIQCICWKEIKRTYVEKGSKEELSCRWESKINGHQVHYHRQGTDEGHD